MKRLVLGSIALITIIVMSIGAYILRKEGRLGGPASDNFGLIGRMETEGVPDFETVNLNGAPFRLKNLRGNVVILNFWASWCNPCIEEFPSMMKLVERFNGDVQLVAISTDENREDVETFLKAFGLPKKNITILLDPKRSVADLYGVGKIPESFLINKDGRLVRKIVGIDDWYSDRAVEYFMDLVGRSEAENEKN